MDSHLNDGMGESSGVTRPYTNMYKGIEIGKFRVICGGRLVVPNGWAGSIFAWLLIIGPSMLQIFMVNPLFGSRESLINSFYCITMLTSLTFLFLTTFTDPGILPRADPMEQRNKLRNMFIAVNDDIEIDHVTIVKGKEVVCMKCRTCNIFRPPRSFHCSDCQACIEVHDHHCPWVGTCVAKRNHRYFLLFGISTAVHAAFTASIDSSALILNLFPSASDTWSPD